MMKNRLLLSIGLALFATTASAIETVNPQPADEVHRRAQKVAPYALDQALQSFTKTVHGGVQHVIAKSADNTKQIKLIQQHLAKIADEFSRGDFSVTERVHGPDMPGLAQLKTAKTDDIKFAYKPLAYGAQIHYSTEYPQFVQALHTWFDAQQREHGNDVIPGHSGDHSVISE